MSLRDERWRDALTARFPALAQLGPGMYVVGGAIRDLHLGREPADVDVACLDPLAAAQRISPRVIQLGDDEQLRAFRVVVPAPDGRWPMADGASNGRQSPPPSAIRHPPSVIGHPPSAIGHPPSEVYDFAELLGGDIDTDLARRDFTVNAMAVDLDRDALLDPHGGRADLEARLVRMVRPSNFDDDPLRVLKGVRMAIRYDFGIEPATLEAMRARAAKITEVARERIVSELTAIFSADRFRRAVALLRESGLDAPLELRTRDFHADDVSLTGAWALLLDEPPRDAQTLRRLIDQHDRISLYDAGEDVARQLPAVLRALGRKDALDWPDFSTRALLTGEEIARLTGLAPGKELGAIKRTLLEAQIRGDVRNVEEAEAFVKRSA